MKVLDICNTIEECAPKHLAEDWDNVGLLVGDFEQQVTGVLICVDLTNGAIESCLANNCNLIVTHHPAIFTPLKSVLTEDFTSSLISKCIKNNISVYSAHTNMDMSEKGINFAFANALNIKPQRFLSDGLGVFGDYNGDFEHLTNKIINITKDNSPKIYTATDNKPKQRVAFIGGAGGRIDEVVSKCKELSINTLISSEFKHNILLELLALNVNVIQIGHFEGETIFVQIIYDLLKSETNNLHKYVSLI